MQLLKTMSSIRKGARGAIELYSDTNSIVRHNTLLYRASCDYNTTCGTIMLTHKTADPAGKGTVLYDNIATAIVAGDGSTYSERGKNLVRSGSTGTDISGAPTFAGGATPTTRAGFQLASNSLGKGAGSTPAGSDIGADLSKFSSLRPGAPTDLRVE